MSRSVHIHSVRLASGEEALLARVVSPAGETGYGFSLTLDATAARHMAEANAGVRPKTGETPFPEEIAKAFASVRWLPA